ncbi:MAG: hypothetical protein ACXADL_16180, partial [Candidatus Thorarchaeota archaeon]
ILDCENGGCDIITCICHVYPLEGVILEDPTGSAYITGGSGPTDWLMVCIEGGKSNITYGEVIVQVTDAALQVAITSHPLVDCTDCCSAFSLTGAATVNPGVDWTGTLTPCCEDAIVDISDGPDCGTVTPTLSGDGCTVTASVSDSACGTFTVRVRQTKTGCDALEATFVVRINNTGQGGSWAFLNSNPGNCNASGNCGCGYGSGLPYAACVFEGFKYGTNNGATFDCSQNFGYSCFGGTSCDDGGSYPPCGGGSYECGDPGPACGNPADWCTGKVWHKCEWSCSCP